MSQISLIICRLKKKVMSLRITYYFQTHKLNNTVEIHY